MQGRVVLSRSWLLLGIVVCLLGQVLAQEWPRWRGAEYAGSATGPEPFPSQFSLRIAWKRTLGSGYSAVVVAEHRAVSMFSDGESDFLVALDARTGSEVWRHRIGPTFPGIEGAMDGGSGTPLIDSGVVYSLGPHGGLIAVDLESGNRLWTVDLVARFGASVPHWGFTTSPVVFGDLLITGIGKPGPAVAAFKKDTGELMWEAESDTVNYQSPIVGQFNGRSQLIFAGDEYLFGLDPVTGSSLWKHAHGGESFYQRIVNPVRVSSDQIFIMHRSTETQMLRIDASGERSQIREVWTSREFKQNYNVPVFYKGYLYGFSRNFLTCIDAKTGSLQWKSRAPGNGFLIIANDHLVVMTKNGTLHVAPADSEGYREAAQVKLFDRRSWTPPSFASGRFYARDSFETIAAVDVVDSEGIQIPLPVEEEFPASRFAGFVREAQAAKDPAQVIDVFMQRQEKFPILEGPDLVHFVYRGPGEEILLGSDLVGVLMEEPFHRLGTTDFFYLTKRVQPKTHLTYHLIRDVEGGLPDPLNPHTVEDPLRYGHEVSELWMPGADPPPNYLQAPATGRKGRLETVEIGGSEERRRKVAVYLPAGYADSPERRYPVLYQLYGNMALSVGKFSNILDHLMGSKVQPAIVVFVPAKNGYEVARSQLPDFLDWFAAELVPDIDRRFRTQRTPGSRAISGGLEAGYGAMFAAFRHPTLIGKVGAQSILEIGAGGEKLLDMVRRQRGVSPLIYLDWGIYDHRNVPAQELVPEFCRALIAAFDERGIRWTGGEVPDGSGFASWRRRTGRLLETLFPLLPH